ncbi:CubicO group peptidase, beta-lactamase class C family [Nocardia amikacinitolerans]|uniref:serine hydrolase domain-containing protein n=1 Tax=Nocardia amikacinitolerans TaxID=756689 RepID=UPI00083738C3|nr:serine hydrolase [Nocardia amikacinitolerans]MCP2315315.1 CubicO group peptidase, beta-lactamase class C family [Nocardia amikacinitolerans]
MTDQPTPSRLRRYAPRIVLALGVIVAVVIGAAFAATPLLRIPGPTTLAQLLSDAPSTQGGLFESRIVPAAPTPRPFPAAPSPLPDTVPWKGSRVPVPEFLAATGTNSFLVVRDGKLTTEWYRSGVGPTTKQSSWSVAKSVVSLLIGRAVEAGKLREDDRLVDILPELANGTDYDTITIRQLLDMASGVDVSENYNPYWPFTGTARMYLTEDLAGFVRDHRDLRFAPGSRGDYRSVDTQLLGMALAEVEGKPLGELLAQQLWAPIGAEDDALWNLDRAGGQEKAFCCLNATARDFAKIGQLVLDSGRVGATQVIPPAWIERLSKPSPLPVIDWGYGAQWWHPTGAEPDLMAIGVYGQYIYVDPPSRTVIVKLSDHGTAQDEAETIAVFRALAAAG